MGNLLAGAAKLTITPPYDLFKRVIALGRYKYKGIAEDLYVRVVVLSNGQKRIALIVSELSMYPMAAALAERLAVECGIDPLGCMIGGTRIHSGFTIPRESFEGMPEAEHDFVNYVHDRTVEAVKEALSRLVPARIGAAYGESGINNCRDMVTPVGTLETACHRGKNAPILPVVRVEDMEGNTIAVLVTYGLHAAMLAWNQFNDTYNYMCGDFAGAVSRYVEKVGKNAFPVMWACGGCSEQFSVCALLDRCDVDENGEFVYVHDVLPAEATLMLIKQFACEQGLDILRTIDSITEYSDDFDFFGAETFREVPQKVPFKKFTPRQMPDSLPEVVPVEQPLRFRFKLAVLNGIAFASSNGELYSTIYTKIREMIPCKVTTMFDVSYGSVSSVPDAECEENNVLGRAYWGSKCISGKAGEDAYLDGFSQLAREYTDYRNGKNSGTKVE